MRSGKVRAIGSSMDSPARRREALHEQSAVTTTGLFFSYDSFIL